MADEEDRKFKIFTEHLQSFCFQKYNNFKYFLESMIHL